MPKELVNQRWRSPAAIENAQAELETTMAQLNEVGEKHDIALFMGSARVKPDSSEYQHAYETARSLGEKGMAIISGGGTGIMEAASRGAKDSGAPSIALTSSLLPKEQVDERLHDMRLALAMFFNRRFSLLTPANVPIIYEGGLGTLNESSELLMLLQNGIVDKVPIYLVQSRKNLLNVIQEDGLRKTTERITNNPIELLWLLKPEGYWDGLRNFMRRHMVARGYISPGDENIGQIINIEEISGEDLAEIISEKVRMDARIAASR